MWVSSPRVRAESLQPRPAPGGVVGGADHAGVGHGRQRRAPALDRLDVAEQRAPGGGQALGGVVRQRRLARRGGAEHRQPRRPRHARGEQGQERQRQQRHRRGGQAQAPGAPARPVQEDRLGVARHAARLQSRPRARRAGQALSKAEPRAKARRFDTAAGARTPFGADAWMSGPLNTRDKSTSRRPSPAASFCKRAKRGRGFARRLESSRPGSLAGRRAVFRPRGGVGCVL